jgi:uncharacterized phiE125 gp8 family phage protein
MQQGVSYTHPPTNIMNNILDVNITTDLTIEPLLVKEAKDYLHIDFDNDDIFLSTLISSSRKALEKFTGLSFGAKTIMVYVDLSEELEIPYGPVNSVTLVRKWTGDSSFDTITDYVLKGSQFKRFDPGVCGEYEITYTAGYSTLPEDLRLAILTEVAYRYENRGDEIVALSNAAKTLAMPYRRLTSTI